MDFVKIGDWAIAQCGPDLVEGVVEAFDLYNDTLTLVTYVGYGKPYRRRQCRLSGAHPVDPGAKVIFYRKIYKWLWPSDDQP